MKTKHYFLVKQKQDNTIIYINYEKLNGIKFKPKNNVKYDGVIVNSLVLIKPTLIEKLLKRKIKRKLEKYLQYIINIMDNEEDEDATRIALNEITRYKTIIISSYKQYLDKKYIELLLKKIELLENEIKSKMYDLKYDRLYEKTKKTR